MARPPLPDDKRRDDTLPVVRVTAAERADVERKASASGVSLTEFCRRAVFGTKARPVMPKADAEAIAALNRVGVNLNQIARHMNAGRNAPADLHATLADVRAAIEAVAGRGS